MSKTAYVIFQTNLITGAVKVVSVYLNKEAAEFYVRNMNRVSTSPMIDGDIDSHIYGIKEAELVN
jgi:hypothetical protein